MGIYINPENSSFKKALSSQIYIDKTGMLEYTNSVLDTEQCYMCISRPRRFGKSVDAGMLTAYYSCGCVSDKLFENLEISQKSDYKRHLNQYNVLHIDIAYFRTQVEQAKDTINLIQQSVIEELKEVFPHCLSDEDKKLPHALFKINKITKASFIVIIDEWDALFREDKKDFKTQQDYISFLRGLFKGEPAKATIKLAYLTGILPIKKYGTQSAMNNFREFTMLNPKILSKYVGFTENEVFELCQEYRMDFSEAKRWYDGYSFRNVEHIYNPNSIVNAMLDGEFDNYWSHTETYESLKNFISMNYDGLKEAIVQMISGCRYKVNSEKFQNDMTSFQGKDDILTLLIHLGYLAYDYSRQEAYIPNEEVKSEFKNAIEGSGWKNVIETLDFSNELLEATWRGDEIAVAKGIEKVHMDYISILQYNDENSLSCVIALAYYNAVNDYTMLRELPTGSGYADIVFLPRKYSDKPAMIVELKWNQSAMSAIDQIKNKKYNNALEEYHGNLLLVGISYDKKSKKHSCRIEKWEK